MMTGRILLVAPFPPPIGGDTVSSARLLESRHWAENGFDIECIDTSPGEGVKTTEVRRTWRDPGRAMRILRQIAGSMQSADIVLLWANSSFIVSLGVPVMWMLRAAGRPYIVKPFGSMLAERLEAAGPIRRRAAVSLLNKACMVLPETYALAEELASGSGLKPDRLMRFPNMIPDGSIPGEIPERDFSGRCVFIGQVKEEKGIFDIIGALRGRDDLSCDFYGQIISRDEKRFFSEIDSCSGCRYRGTIPGGEVMQVLGQYDALLLPTFHPGEGYPAVILESFAAGIPVITTRWKALPELVEDGERGLLISPRSPGEITSAIDRLAGNADLRRRLAGNAMTFVRGFTEGTLITDVLLPLIRRSLERTEG